MFKNATIFRFAPAVGIDLLCRLSHEASLAPLPELEPSQMNTVGFVPLDNGAFSHWIGLACYVRIADRRRVITAAMVKEILLKKVAEIERSESRTVGSRERNRMKEEVVIDLVPHAPIVTKTWDCLVHAGENWIIVDTASPNAAEFCVNMIRHTLGSFAAQTLDPAVYVRDKLDYWLSQQVSDTNIVVGDNCKLIDESGAIAAYTNQSLIATEIFESLSAGKRVKQLSILLYGKISVVLTDALILKRLRFLDDCNLADAEDKEQLLALQALELGLVVNTIFAIFECETPL